MLFWSRQRNWRLLARLFLQQIIEEGLPNAIETKHQYDFRLRDGSFGGQGLVRKMTWDEIRDAINQGRGA